MDFDEDDPIWQRTGKYGYMTKSSKHFDGLEFLSRKVLNYKLSRIKVWLGQNNRDILIVGIQCFYKNINTNKEETPGEFLGSDPFKTVEEITLDHNEYLNNFYIRCTSPNNQISCIGFSTNKGQVKHFGSEIGEEINTRLENKKITIYGLYGCYSQTLESCGIIYVERQEFIRRLLFGYFHLRYLLFHNEKIKEYVKNLKNLDEEDIILLKVCKLPLNVFTRIIRCLIP